MSHRTQAGVKMAGFRGTLGLMFQISNVSMVETGTFILPEYLTFASSYIVGFRDKSAKIHKCYDMSYAHRSANWWN